MNRKIILILLLIGAALIAAAILRLNKFSASATKQTPPIAQKQNIDDIKPATANDNPDNQRAKTPNIPILMYHHIRDYENANDQTGTNLSVSPSELSRQLDLIKESGYETITFSDLENYNTFNKPIILTFDDGYDNFYLNAYPELIKRAMKAALYVIVNDIGKDGYINTAQIIEMQNGGIEIGSHTLSHPDLTTISSDKATQEIRESKFKLEKIIGKIILSFCYPAGKVNDTVAKIVKDAGYQYAVTTKSGIAKFSDPLLLNRYRVNKGTNIQPYLK